MKALTNQNGFSLLAALISSLIMGIASVGLHSIVTLSIKSTSHVGLRSAVHSLSDSLKLQVDCNKTFEGIDLAKACASGAETPLVLRDSLGKPITGDLRTPAFSSEGPQAPDLSGAAKFGDFHLRAYCNSADGNLVIRFARPAGNNSVGASLFMADPLNNREMDWSNGKLNPLLGTPDRQICRGPQSDGAGPTPTPTPSAGDGRKMSTLALNFNGVYNLGFDAVNVDMTKNPPQIVDTASNVTLHSYAHATAFAAAPFLVQVGIRFTDVRTKYSNISATPIVAWDMHPTKPGVVRIRLLANSDLEQSGRAIGSMGISVLLIQ